MPGARVFLTWQALSPEEQQEFEACNATANEQGELEVPPTPRSDPYFRAFFAAYAPGLAVAPAEREPALLRFRLGPETRLPVRVVTADGSPVSGVHLQVSKEVTPPPAGGPKQSGYIGFGAQLSRLLIAPSAADGRTVIPALCPDAKVSLFVRDPEWVQAETARELTVALSGNALQAEHKIVVRKAAWVQGTLSTERGQPIPGYRVFLCPKSGSETPPDWVAAAADGSFEVKGLAAGRYAVQLIAPPNDPAAEVPQPDLSLAPGERRAGYRIERPAGSVVTGRLVFAESGLPVAGATIHYGTTGDCILYGGKPTGPDGRFRLRLRPGDGYSHLTPPDGYDHNVIRYQSGNPFSGVRTTENGKDYDLGEVRVMLRKLHPIRGAVLRHDGSPAPGATVYYQLVGAPANTLEWTPRVTTGIDGQFETPAIQAEGDGVYCVRAVFGDESTRADVRVPLRTNDPPKPVRLELESRPLAVVRGRVTDENGAPVAGATVVVSRFYEPSQGATPAFPTTDADGRFEIRLWPEEEYWPGAGAEGFGSIYLGRICPRPGVTVLADPIVLKKPTAFLDLLLTDWAGSPLRNVPVELENPARQPYFIHNPYRTDSGGRLHVSGLLAGTYRIHYGHARVDGEAPTGKTRYRISLPRPADPAQPTFRSP